MDPEPEPEYELALRAKQGDGEALARLVALLRVSLFALAYAELGNYEDAQDAVAAALLRVCQHIGNLKQAEQVRPWMNRIVRNEARRLRRRARSHKTVAAEPQEEWLVAPQCLPSVTRLDIERALQQLPQEHARAIALFYLAGLPVGEIARRVGRPEGTVKFWLHQGRHQLAREMKGYAPMTPETEPTTLWTASIISTDLAPDLLARMVTALKTAGWDKVNLVDDFEAAGRLAPAGEGNESVLHLPPFLKESRCLVLDEWIGGRSAFEWISAAVERKNVGLLLLAGQQGKVPETLVRAAYMAGVDMLLTKPFNIAEFENFGRQLRAGFDQKA